MCVIVARRAPAENTCQVVAGAEGKNGNLTLLLET